jgi:uncharacterized DUF497 family protein
MISFEWDERKAALNLGKHGVGFPEARSVFFDDFAIQFLDEDNAADEERFLILGMSGLGRTLLVVHCMRSNDEVIRIISARKATPAERAYYKGPYG